MNICTYIASLERQRKELEKIGALDHASILQKEIERLGTEAREAAKAEPWLVEEPTDLEKANRLKARKKLRPSGLAGGDYGSFDLDDDLGLHDDGPKEPIPGSDEDLDAVTQEWLDETPKMIEISEERLEELKADAYKWSKVATYLDVDAYESVIEELSYAQELKTKADKWDARENERLTMIDTLKRLNDG